MNVWTIPYSIGSMSETVTIGVDDGHDIPELKHFHVNLLSCYTFFTARTSQCCRRIEDEQRSSRPVRESTK